MRDCNVFIKGVLPRDNGELRYSAMIHSKTKVNARDAFKREPYHLTVSKKKKKRNRC